jgi:hypothetical protein
MGLSALFYCLTDRFASQLRDVVSAAAKCANATAVQQGATGAFCGLIWRAQTALLRHVAAGYASS